MAFTNPGKIVRLRSRPNGHGSVYEANMWAQQHSDGLFSGRGVIRNTVADMNVLVGGTTDNPDVVLGKLPSGFLIALDIVGQQVIRITAPSSNKRIASVVAYSDNIALNSTDTNTTGSPSSCGLIVVYGSTSATPVAPTESQIRQAVTQDGATGSQAVIAVIANITTESSTTTITDEMIAINYGKLSSHSIDSTTMLTYGANNSAQTISGSLVIQSGWVSFYGNGGKQQSVQVTFPKKFKEVYAVIPTLIGYTRNTPTSPASFDQKIGAGTNIECGSFNQTGTTITTSTSGIFGGANHGISWIAVGTV